MTCSCACHVGGAYRPPCDVPGGCGSQHTREPESRCRAGRCARMSSLTVTLGSDDEHR